jgi:hypothetical protein
MDLRNPFSKRVTRHDPPPPVNPITGRPYGVAKPEPDEQAARELAAGQAALASAVVPEPIQVGYDPQRSAWRGARD